MGCPQNSIVYNGSLCACPPGQLPSSVGGGGCRLFDGGEEFLMNTGVDHNGVSFPETLFSFDSIKKFSQSQAVFLEATLVMMLSWLLMCFFLRFAKLGDGRSLWFRLRWWISRLDISFATRHWLDDQKVVTKRKTELGGTFSIASWILFIGLFAALLYQIISKRTIEVHNVRATNAPDLAGYINDMEINITTISTMTCSNLRGLGTLVTGSPGFVDSKISPLSSLFNYSCHNSSTGPTLSFKCTECRLSPDYMYISWQFVDLPNNPASAVGFLFNYTAKNRSNKKHLSFVSGTLKNGSVFDGRPVTFRGMSTNILKFNLFPQLYRNLHDLRILQPLFHEFVPGSSFSETSQLRASLERSGDGLLNTTLYINNLSTYVIEIENRSIIGPVSFLADLGGLYCFSIGIFFYLLVQCEYRIKKLRNEDSVLRRIRNRRRAQERWDKLRKYVMYTWGCRTLVDDYVNTKNESACSNSCVPTVRGLPKRVSSQKRRQQRSMDSVSFSFHKKTSLPSEKNGIPDRSHGHEVECCSTVTANPEEKLSCPKDETLRHPQAHGSANSGKKKIPSSCGEYASQTQKSVSADENNIPPPPPLVLKPESEVEMSDIQKNFQRLYDYNVMLREKLVAAQSALHALADKSSSPAPESQT